MFENVVNDIGNLSIHAPALVVIPGKREEACFSYRLEEPTFDP